MGKSDFMTPKDIANRVKAKGLQKLRWYCQMCEKQCRDENGFKCHTTSESHQRMMALVADNPNKYVHDYSKQFRKEFLDLLSKRFGTRSVKANAVYNEYIQDRHHVHMNATSWSSLAGFVRTLGRDGVVEVEETDNGLFIRWKDTRPETLARAEAGRKKEKQERDDDDVERELLQQQAERARELADKRGAPLDSASELLRVPNAVPFKLDMSLKRPAAATFVKPTKLSKLVFGGGNSSSMGSKATKVELQNGEAQSGKWQSGGVSNGDFQIGGLQRALPVGGLGTRATHGTQRKSALEEIVEAEERKKQRVASQTGGPRSENTSTAPYRSSPQRDLRSRPDPREPQRHERRQYDQRNDHVPNPTGDVRRSTTQPGSIRFNDSNNNDNDDDTRRHRRRRSESPPPHRSQSRSPPRSRRVPYD